jgi:quercetin dioxygenase-like cupin family protein
MIEQQEGSIVRLSDLQGRDDLEGHPGVVAYNFARPGANCRWLLVTLDVIEENGGIEPHYHAGVDFDHAYYVIEGEVIATVGDKQQRVGPDSLMTFPCATVHGFKVVSPGGAKILRLGASDTGVASGGNTYLSNEG